MNDWLKLYYRLPPPLRTLAASARGYYLRWWRYGPQTEQWVEEALERETWSTAQWKTWQEERLAYILERAARKVPYYHEYWNKRRQQGDRAAWDVLENWPILEKETVRRNLRLFVADDCNRRKMYPEHTSGTTGTPLINWLSRNTLQRWYALSEARWRRWYGVSPQDRWAMIGGQPVVPFQQITPPFWVWNAGLNQLYLSSLHIKPGFLHHYLRAIEKYAITYLLGYSSGLYWLAVQAIEEGIQIPFTVAVTNAEPLFERQRRAIQQAFACPARETYGQGEFICAASECEYGKLHLWPEVGWLELLTEDDKPCQPGEPGRIISTSLLNADMPLIRYDTRDIAIASEPGLNCSCGKNLPQIEKIIGRLDDTIVTPDGRQVIQLDNIFSPDLQVREAQIIQESLDQFTIKVVPAKGWSNKDDEAIRNALQQRVGEVDVTIQLVPLIERTWEGKFKVVVSKMGFKPPEG